MENFVELSDIQQINFLKGKRALANSLSPTALRESIVYEQPVVITNGAGQSHVEMQNHRLVTQTNMIDGSILYMPTYGNEGPVTTVSKDGTVKEIGQIHKFEPQIPEEIAKQAKAIENAMP